MIQRGRVNKAIVTTLSAGITAVSTSLVVVNNIASFPASGIIVIDSEQIYYNSIVTTTLTGLYRGYGGTTPAIHNSGDAIYFLAGSNGASIKSLPYVFKFPSAIPATSITLFQQSTAPVGWTKLSTHNNKALRLVTGTAGSGGSLSFSSVFTDTAPTITSDTLAGDLTSLSGSQIGIHTHGVRGADSSRNNWGIGLTAYGASWGTGYVTMYNPGATTIASGSTGSGTGHSHAISGTASIAPASLSVMYVDVILAQKD